MSEDVRPTVLRRRLGDVLVSSGLIDPDTLADALRVQADTGKRLGQILLARGDVRSQELAGALASLFGMEAVDLSTVVPDPDAVSRLPEALARRLHALPLSFAAGRLQVAVDDPSDVVALDDIRTAVGSQVHLVVAPASQLAQAIEVAWQSDLADSRIDAMPVVPPSDDTPDLAHAVGEAPVVRLVNQLLVRALRERASDIHLESTATGGRVRFRVDGMLHDVLTIAADVVVSAVARIKVMASLDIAQRRLPQDGRMSLRLAGADIDVRVATLPTVRGESMVLRLLDKRRGSLDIADLGFLPDTLATFEAAYTKPWGAVLVTGPTGCGKTTTLFAALTRINVAERNIITVEDPIEYEIDGIKQVQVFERTGLSFARVLRSALRCDPDTILVGEIRDQETARIAADAALTGHLVLSTLHTNDAPSAPTRLVEMGLEPFLIASALDCVLAQRLARGLCSHCRQPFAPTEEELAAAGWDASGLPIPDRLYRAGSCPECRHTGFVGRFAIHEVMPITHRIRELILAVAPATAVRSEALADGMRPLRNDGLCKVADGRTSLEELTRVVAADTDQTVAPGGPGAVRTMGASGDGPRSGDGVTTHPSTPRTGGYERSMAELGLN